MVYAWCPTTQGAILQRCKFFSGPFSTCFNSGLWAIQCSNCSVGHGEGDKNCIPNTLLQIWLKWQKWNRLYFLFHLTAGEIAAPFLFPTGAGQGHVKVPGIPRKYVLWFPAEGGGNNHPLCYVALIQVLDWLFFGILYVCVCINYINTTTYNDYIYIYIYIYINIYIYMISPSAPKLFLC